LLQFCSLNVKLLFPRKQSLELVTREQNGFVKALRQEPAAPVFFIEHLLLKLFTHLLTFLLVLIFFSNVSESLLVLLLFYLTPVVDLVAIHVQVLNLLNLKHYLYCKLVQLCHFFFLKVGNALFSLCQGHVDNFFIFVSFGTVILQHIDEVADLIFFRHKLKTFIS